jgi:hypothetical protein
MEKIKRRKKRKLVRWRTRENIKQTAREEEEKE